MSFLSSLKNIGDEALTFVESFFTNEAATLAPIAENAVANLAVSEAEAIATGDSKDTGHILATVTNQTIQAAEVAGIKAAAPSIAVAVGLAAAKAPALVAAKAAATT